MIKIAVQMHHLSQQPTVYNNDDSQKQTVAIHFVHVVYVSSDLRLKGNVLSQCYWLTGQNLLY